jgi:uncharacterized membrane protein YphA (DoxX/SURF4 family)
MSPIAMSPIDWFALGLRLGLGALFIVAGWLKLADPNAFALEIVNYRFFPELAPYLAATLPATEIVLGAAVIVARPRWQRAASLALAALLAVFTVAVTQAYARGINVDCGCFGGSSGPVTRWTIVRDILLVAAAATVYLLSGRRATHD